MNLEKRLTQWIKAGLLSAEQAEGIRAWERRQPSPSWILFGIAGIGIIALLTGVISIIAANWGAIPREMKLSGYFISLAILGFFVVQRIVVPGVIRESLLVAFALYILAGIGLIGQVYHLQMGGYTAIVWWCTLTLPLALLARSQLLVYLWCGGLAFGVWLRFLTQHGDLGISYAVFAALPWLYLGAGYLLWSRVEYLAAALRTLGYGGLLLGWGIAANIAWSDGTHILFISREGGILGLLPLGAFCLALGVVALLRCRIGSAGAATIFVTLSTAGLLILIPTYFTFKSSLLTQILGCALFIGAWSSGAATAARLGRRRLFDFAASIVALRFVVAYFEVFGSLAATGIGLIISGGVILGIAYLWHRFRGAVALTMEGKR
ncbi:MAG: hypothetical protein RL417_1895 [Pseudomonadota bacterium]|jgi:uncharacterized membrane protein